MRKAWSVVIADYLDMERNLIRAGHERSLMSGSVADFWQLTLYKFTRTEAVHHILQRKRAKLGPWDTLCRSLPMPWNAEQLTEYFDPPALISKLKPEVRQMLDNEHCLPESFARTAQASMVASADVADSKAHPFLAKVKGDFCAHIIHICKAADLSSFGWRRRPLWALLSWLLALFSVSLVFR